jgi:hypothetical protein
MHGKINIFRGVGKCVRLFGAVTENRRFPRTTISRASLMGSPLFCIPANSSSECFELNSSERERHDATVAIQEVAIAERFSRTRQVGTGNPKMPCSERWGFKIRTNGRQGSSIGHGCLCHGTGQRSRLIEGTSASLSGSGLRIMGEASRKIRRLSEGNPSHFTRIE